MTFNAVHWLGIGSNRQFWRFINDLENPTRAADRAGKLLNDETQTLYRERQKQNVPIQCDNRTDRQAMTDHLWAALPQHQRDTHRDEEGHRREERTPRFGKARLVEVQLLLDN